MLHPTLPFEACYRVNRLTLIQILPFLIKNRVNVKTQERAKEMKKLHKQIRAQIEKINASYKARANKHRKHMVFQPGRFGLIAHKEGEILFWEVN